MIADKAAAKCYWHSMVEPVGNCTVCGQAGCGTCLVQEPAGYRCHECIRKGRQIVQATPVQPQLIGMPPPGPPYPNASPLPDMTPMQPQSPSIGQFLPKDRKILISLFVFLVGVAIPFLVVNPKPTLQQHITLGYVLWALFWGAPTAWRLGRRIVSWLASFGCSGIGLGFGVAWVTGWFYCVFGGGIYQFFKHWRSVSRTV